MKHCCLDRYTCSNQGSNYMSGDFQNEIKCLGIEASPSFVREPQGNGVAERFIDRQFDETTDRNVLGDVPVDVEIGRQALLTLSR